MVGKRWLERALGQALGGLRRNNFSLKMFFLSICIHIFVIGEASMNPGYLLAFFSHMLLKQLKCFK